MTALGLLAGLASSLGLGACFSAPQPAVQFSCDPDEAPECPEGYTCEADGCCHLDGSDYEAHEGECSLAGFPTGLATEGPTGAATDTNATDTNATDTNATDTIATDTASSSGPDATSPSSTSGNISGSTSDTDTTGSGDTIGPSTGTSTGTSTSGSG